ncbi:MAG TPA: hypothetical protein VJL58_01510 [Pyrinomonadaceae bacterium]|nr:hypothetical protein [Pyrinomonadaceae bacterium]
MTRVLVGFVILITSISLSFGQKQARAEKVREGDSKQLKLTSDTRLDAQLQSTLDVKSAKVGDEVAFKTTKAVKQNGETVIQKGSMVYGRITEVQQRTSSNAMSKIGLVFDRIEGKDLSAPISASIVSVTNIAGRAAVDDTLGSDIAGSSTTSARTTSSGGSGGGLLGGVGSTVGNTVGGVLNTTTQTAGSVVGTAGNTVGTTTGTVGRTVGGIQISSSANASANSSTTLSSPNKNLRLEKGLLFQLNVDGQAREN